MMANNRPVWIEWDDDAIKENMFFSQEMLDDVVEVAETLVNQSGDAQRYQITTSTSGNGKTRVYAYIVDDAPDALNHEAKHGTLLRLSKKRNVI